MQQENRGLGKDSKIPPPPTHTHKCISKIKPAVPLLCILTFSLSVNLDSDKKKKNYLFYGNLYNKTFYLENANFISDYISVNLYFLRKLISVIDVNSTRLNLIFFFFIYKNNNGI